MRADEYRKFAGVKECKTIRKELRNYLIKMGAQRVPESTDDPSK